MSFHFSMYILQLEISNYLTYIFASFYISYNLEMGTHVKLRHNFN
uniref:Uncharacterized protein n=1 Tax=Arundo donax TaxID=35708 RepID=A0A0A8Y8K4_ARUDO